MPGVAPVGAGLGGVHQSLVDRKLRHAIGLSGLVDQPDHLLPDLLVVCQVGAVPVSGGGRGEGGGWSGGGDGQHYAPAFPGAVGCGNLRSPRPLCDSHPEGQHPLNRYRVRVTGGDGVVGPAGADDQAASLSHLQGTALVVAHPDGFVGRFRCRGRDGEPKGEGGCRQCGGNAFFHAGHTFFLLYSVFCGAFASNTISEWRSKVEKKMQSKTEKRGCGNEADYTMLPTAQVSTPWTHHRWSRWSRTQV